MLHNAVTTLLASIIKVSEAFRPASVVDNSKKAVVSDGEVFSVLEWAGNYLLDGDIEAMRGVPLTSRCVRWKYRSFEGLRLLFFARLFLIFGVETCHKQCFKGVLICIGCQIRRPRYDRNDRYHRLVPKEKGQKLF